MQDVYLPYRSGKPQNDSALSQVYLSVVQVFALHNALTYTHFVLEVKSDREVLVFRLTP